MNSSLCNIPKYSIDLLNNINFQSLESIPMIFIPSKQSNSFHSIANMNNLLNNYYNEIIHLTSSNTLSQGYLQMTLGDYISNILNTSLDDITNHNYANQSYYLFGNNYHGIFNEIIHNYNIPNCYHCQQAAAVTPGIGGYHSGVNWHFHGGGFSEVIIGKKRWLLYPPEIKESIPGYDINKTVSSWIETIYPHLHEYQVDTFDMSNILPVSHKKSSTFQSLLYECEIEPGEILYFPNNWMHATLNTAKFTMFISTFIDQQLL